VTIQDYQNTYGVTEIPGGLELKFVSTGGGGGMNVGSRLYLMDTSETYKLFKLKNREFTFDVDVSTLRCGLNGAVYFSEMEADGGLSATNQAGAKYGTGYCDAQCPADVKFMGGKANILDWNETSAMGRWGQCCVEMDVWEANREDTALTPHPCNTAGPMICEGVECGGKPGDAAQRYAGVCDKDGCDFNSYRLGETSFFGHGSDFTVNTEEPITVVTQWLTDDGTDDGDLSEIRRLYVQGGRVIENSRTTALGDVYDGNSITEPYCKSQKTVFEDPDDFHKKGGLQRMGQALDRGMVLVLSLWDDHLTQMRWLDSRAGTGLGSLRGPCPEDSGAPAEVRSKYPNAAVKYTNFMYGEVGSTYTDATRKPAVARPAAAPRTAAPTIQALPPPAPTMPPLAQTSQPPQPLPPQPPPQPMQQPQQQQQQLSPVPALPGGSCAGPYFQCGGKGFSGPTCCSDGSTCMRHDDYYSQCTPAPGFQPGMAGAIMKKDLESGPGFDAHLAAAEAAAYKRLEQRQQSVATFAVAWPAALVGALLLVAGVAWLWTSLWPVPFGLYLQFRRGSPHAQNPNPTSTELLRRPARQAEAEAAVLMA
jgi:cellulose 1,4-beta-cellobiosidase